MGDADRPRYSIATADDNGDPGETTAQTRIEVLWHSIVQSLASQASNEPQTEYSDFEHAATLAFAMRKGHYSRFAGPITATSRFISEALSLVAANSETATRVLDSVDQLLPYVSGASPTVAWGLIDLIETALWCIEEPEFSLLRAGRLLLLSYFQSNQNTLHPQHALAMSLLLARCRELQIKKLNDGAIPLTVRLLISIGQHDEPPNYEKNIDELYWADCDYLRLAVNANYGVRVFTLLKMIDDPRLGIKKLWQGHGVSVLGRVNMCELVALMLLSKLDANQELDLGVCATRLHTLLSMATSEFGRVDGPALMLKNQLEIIIDTTVWLLALQGLPPPLRDNNCVRKITRLGCDSAVTILCTGTKLFKPHTCIGACLLLRSYARSVHALRTEQIVSAERTNELCGALKRLLIEEPEGGVDEAVAGLLCNLLIDFSRLREPLISLDIIPTLCDALYRNQSNAMLVSTLWALRNVCALRDAIEIEQLSFRSLDRVDILKPLLVNEDREVTRLFCALLGNVSPTNLREIYGLLGGRKVIIQYLMKRIEYWQWPSVQEAASQALANLTAAIALEDSEPDPLTRDLCKGMVRCLKHPGASQTLLANVGYMISNALLIPEHETPSSEKMANHPDVELTPFSRKVLGGLMIQEGVYEALTEIDSPMLSVRNSLVSARNALEVTADAAKS